MRRIYQVYSGAGAGRNITAKQVIDALPDGSRPTDLIVGWSREPGIYREIRAYADRAGIRLWLWFPVFSENTAELGLKPIVAIGNGNVSCVAFDGDEKFDFCCPSDPSIGEKLLGLYDAVFSDIGFDGVFLDRLRHPSLSAGLEALFGCCCGECVEWYSKHGMSKRDIRDIYEALKRRILDQNNDNPLSLKSYGGGETRFEDAVLEQFLKLNAMKTAAIVKTLVCGFRARKLEIGMDLFAPFLSIYVGQDYVEMAKQADFIKPMLYRLTDTPAGMGWEMRAIARAISKNSLTYSRRLNRLLSFYDAGESYYNLFCRELKGLAHLEEKLGRRGLFVPGIDIHTVPELPGLPVGEIRRSVEVAERVGFEGRVACWNLLASSREEVEAFLNRRE